MGHAIEAEMKMEIAVVSVVALANDCDCVPRKQTSLKWVKRVDRGRWKNVCMRAL